MKIVFKGGTEAVVTKQVAETICQQIKDGCFGLSTFDDANVGGLFIVNLTEILYISTDE